MASGVAHDLNQSLALIAGYTGLVREALGRRVDATVLEHLDTMQRAALDGGEILKRLLGFAQALPEGVSSPIDEPALALRHHPRRRRPSVERRPV